MSRERAEAAAQAIEKRAIAKGVWLLKLGYPVSEVVRYLSQIAAVTIATVLFVRSWTATNVRLDHDLPELTDAAQWCRDFGHNFRPELGTALLICQQCGSRQEPCQVHGHDRRGYADYHICIACGLRSDDRKAS